MPLGQVPPGRKIGIEGHQRVDAENNIGAILECDRGVEGFDQRPIDIVPAIDFDGRKKAGQGGAGLDGGGNRHRIVAVGTESDRLAGIEVGRHQKKAALEFAKIIGAPGPGKHFAEHMIDALVIKNPGRNGAGQALEGFKRAVQPRCLKVVQR